MLTLFLLINTLIIVLFMSKMNQLTKNWSRSTGITLGIFLQGLGFIIAFLLKKKEPVLTKAGDNA